MADAASQQAIESAIRLQRAGQLADAELAYRHLLARDPDNAAALHLLGILVGRSGRPQEAVELLRRCIQICPEDATAHASLGTALHSLGDDENAMAHFQRSVELQPESAEAQYNLGKALRDRKENPAAAEAFRRAVQLQPALAPAWNNLGNTLRELEQAEEAAECYRKSLQLRPNHPQTLHNLGLAYKDVIRLDDAMRCFDAALALDPAHHECRVSQAMVLLLRGDFERGWREYEARWNLTRAFTRPSFSQPLWDGSNPAGSTLLLHSEQGFGDTIQFSRYAPLLVERGAKVILVCQRELRPLLATLDGIGPVLDPGEQPPPFDAYRPLMSLPMVLGTTPPTIPARVPYLKADPSRVDRWRNRIGDDGLRIGIAWAGAAGYLNDRNRSIPLAMLAPLAQVPGVRLYSLQKGPAADQTSALPAAMSVFDFTPELHDFADTAALIQNLDLVISVDTAVAHLAGALAKPVWVLLPFSPDWRWMIDRDDSPWYPTLRLFRQQQLRRWQEVVERVAQSLGEYRHPES